MDFFNIKETILKYTKSKKTLTFFLIFIIGFVLVLFPAKLSATKKDTVTATGTDTLKTEEARLEKMLTSVDGIKKVKVMICFYDNGVKEYYKDESEDRDDSNVRSDKKMVITRKDGDETPVLKRELSPDIKGVSIVANCKKRGMEDLIYRLTSKALGVDIHKIEVVINDRS